MPKRLRAFFEQNEVQRYEQLFAANLRHLAGSQMLAVAFASRELAEDQRHAQTVDPAGAARYFPLASVGDGADEPLRFLAVDPADAALPVVQFYESEGYSPYAPSFAAFLAGLLRKSGKTPTRKLAAAVALAGPLFDQGHHQEVIRRLQPLAEQVRDSDIGTLMLMGDPLGDALTLLAQSFAALGRHPEAGAALERAIAAGSNAAVLLKCDLLLTDAAGARRLLALAQREVRTGTGAWLGDAVYLLKGYEVRAHLLLGQGAKATALIGEMLKKNLEVELLEQLAAPLRGWVQARRTGHETAARIIKDLEAASAGSTSTIEPLSWWAGLSKATKKQFRSSFEFKGEPTPARVRGIWARRELYLGYAELTELTLLAPFTQLTELDVSNNPGLTALRFPHGIRRVRELRAKDCGLTTLEGVEQLTELEVLDVTDNKITSLASLASLPRLEDLRMQDNNISTLAPLVGCRGLKYLCCLQAGTGRQYFNPSRRDVAAFRKQRKDVEVT